MARSYLFTSESVTEGHPDKMADQVSDAILDAILKQDTNPATARCAVETLFKTGVCIVAGEVRTNAWVDVPAVVRRTINRIGFTSSEVGFDGATCGVLSAIEGQSNDIAMGVDVKGKKKEQGAGDQGLMFGFACDETDELMPMPIAFAHRLTKRLADARKNGDIPWLRPDGKSQVTIAYEDGRPAYVDTIVISTQHGPEVTQKKIRDAIIDDVIRKTLPAAMLKRTQFHVNPTGQFIVGGPMGDAGVTGRKIIVDTYGGMGRHGGGAFSGKDPSKVDRSAAYMARYVAKNVVAASLARRCEVQLAYAIGVAEPVSVMVECFGTESVTVEKIEKAVRKLFPLKPAGLIEHLDLLTPIYEKTASYGHFGRAGFAWEKTDLAAALRDECGMKKAQANGNGHANGFAARPRPTAKAKKKTAELGM
jgi:S-adenosylmethionine synthetase